MLTMILFQNEVNTFTAMTHTKITPARPKIFSHKNWVFFTANAFKMEKKIQNIWSLNVLTPASSNYTENVTAFQWHLFKKMTFTYTLAIPYHLIGLKCHVVNFRPVKVMGKAVHVSKYSGTISTIRKWTLDVDVLKETVYICQQTTNWNCFITTVIIFNSIQHQLNYFAAWSFDFIKCRSF